MSKPLHPHSIYPRSLWWGRRFWSSLHGLLTGIEWATWLLWNREKPCDCGLTAVLDELKGAR